MDVGSICGQHKVSDSAGGCAAVGTPQILSGKLELAAGYHSEITKPPERSFPECCSNCQAVLEFLRPHLYDILPVVEFHIPRLSGSRAIIVVTHTRDGM